MKFISVRDLSQKPGRAWKALKGGDDLVVTSNGKPVAILTGVEEDDVESTIRAIRYARAFLAMERMQSSAVRAGLDKMTRRDVEKEIAAVREGRTHEGGA